MLFDEVSQIHSKFQCCDDNDDLRNSAILRNKYNEFHMNSNTITTYININGKFDHFFIFFFLSFSIAIP